MKTAIRRANTTTKGINGMVALTAVAASACICACDADVARDSESETAAVQAAITAPRKTILVLVAPNLYAGLTTELVQFAADLGRDGWKAVVRTSATTTAAELRNSLRSEYLASDLAGAFLVGKHPFALADEQTGPGSHGFTDYYLMDLDGEWVDTTGEGSFDLLRAPPGATLTPEIFVGRLDGSVVDLYGKSELDMVRDYFRRNHEYRTGTVVPPSRAVTVVGEDFASTWYSRAIYQSLLGSYSDTMTLTYQVDEGGYAIPGGQGKSWPVTSPEQIWPPPPNPTTGVAFDMIKEQMGSAPGMLSVGAHGWPGGWGGLPAVPDILDLVTQGRKLPPIVMSWACSTASLSDRNSMASMFAMGGSLDVVGYSASSSILYDWNVELLNAFATGTIGQAMQHMHDYVFASGGSQMTLDWSTALVVLHGDPTLRHFVNQPNLKVWIKDEGSNLQSSAFALYVENVGTTPISNFKLRYAFSHEEQALKTVALQDNYSPWSTPRLGGSSPASKYVEFDFSGKTLNPGQVSSGGPGGGEKVRIYYADWSNTWDESNDYSAVKGRNFATTGRVDVYDAAGRRIYGFAR